MQVTREDINACTVQLTVVCDPEQVRDGFARAFKQASKSIRVPGFRPGHAPRALLEKSVDPEALKEMAADNIVRSVYKSAIEDQKIEPFNSSHVRPVVELKSLDQETSACEFTMKVPLPPKVEIGDYLKLPVQKPAIEVTDAEIDHQIEEMRKRRSTREQITERGVQEGDVAVVNIKVDGEEGEGRNFMTIAGQTFPQLDQAVLSMKIEEMKHMELSFPDTFQEKDWAGKTLQTQITLRNLSAVKLPEIDEEFAKSYQTETVEELRTRLKQGIKNAKDEAVVDYVNEQLLEELAKRSTIEVPDMMWEDVASRRLQDINNELREKNVTFEDYAKEQGMTIEEFVEAQKAEAKTFVYRAQMINEIFQREKMQLTNVELNVELMKMAREFNLDPKDMLNLLKKNDAVQELHFRSINGKVMDFLRDQAEITEVSAD